MALPPGTRLGPYEVVATVGGGGMGEVYRSWDTRLEREVAIKILPPAFSSDPERLQRFQQEARVLSALNHPNLLVVFDVGVQDGLHYLVSEYLQGQTLRAAMSASPVSTRRISEYSLQIASGLAAAHDKHIIHRDLKPENIFITREERVKILDFGLAKYVRAPAGESESQTMTSPGPTGAGIVLGTVGYMSPEQVRGQEVDHRADIFSFGAILYEMISGKRAFAGDTSVETMNAILKQEAPELTEAPQVSPGLDRVVRRCLEKSPEHRFQSASDLAFAIEALSGSFLAKQVSPRTAREPALVGLAAKPPLRWWIAALSLVAMAFAVGWVLSRSSQPATEESIFRLQFDPPEGGEFVFGSDIGGVSLSPDGRIVAYVAKVNGKTGLWMRPLDSIAARLLAGTEGAANPFWSPDSKSIAFSAGGQLWRVDLAGAAPLKICDVPDFLGGAWSSDGRILFGALGSGLFQVPASGGPHRRSQRQIVRAAKPITPGRNYFRVAAFCT